jgi:hypothetical protein
MRNLDLDSFSDVIFYLKKYITMRQIDKIINFIDKIDVSHNNRIIQRQTVM